MSMKFRLAVDDGHDEVLPWNARLRVPYCPPEGTQSATDTSHGNHVDVNTIIARFARTGELPPARRAPQYGDVTALQGDLTESYSKSQADIATFRQDADNYRAAKQKEMADARKTAAEAPRSDDAPTPNVDPPKV